VADTKLRAAQLATGRGAGHRSGTVSLYLNHAVIMSELRAFISIIFYEFDRCQAPGRMRVSEAAVASAAEYSLNANAER
jgi:hypothetical protein